MNRSDWILCHYIACVVLDRFTAHAEDGLDAFDFIEAATEEGVDALEDPAKWADLHVPALFRQDWEHAWASQSGDWDTIHIMHALVEETIDRVVPIPEVTA